MARDDEVALSDTLEAAASRCDAIVASGGVSVGDHDVLRVVLGNLGGRSMRSLDIAVKPGEHVAVARLGEKRTRAAPRRCARTIGCTPSGSPARETATSAVSTEAPDASR
jgi:molybdopterin biosynthesis enzyme